MEQMLTLLIGNRYKHTRQMQFAFFILSGLCGGRLIYMINRANWRANMKMVRSLPFFMFVVLANHLRSYLL